MTCGNITEATFSLYTYDLQGNICNENKTFTVEIKEANVLAEKFGRRATDTINRDGIILTMFQKIYNFDVGFSGFALKWIDDFGMQVYNDEEALRLKTDGVIYWRVDTWRIKRVV